MVKPYLFMTFRFRLFVGALLYLGVLTSFSRLEAQSFTGAYNDIVSPALKNRLTHWEVFQIDADAFNDAIKGKPDFSETELHLGNHHWKLNLVPSGIIPPGYTLQVLTPNGLEVIAPKENKAFKGYEINGGGIVRLTVDEDFIYGFVSADGGVYYIEPLWYYEPSAPHNLFVVYERNAVIRDNIDGTCAVVESEEKAEQLMNGAGPSNDDPQTKLQACYQAELAIASDKSMFNKYGSVTAVENHNIGVINDVNTDYSGSFNNDIVLTIVTQFVVTGTDPWTNSTNPDVLLSSFRTWGNNGNFGVPFDLAELWSNRDFDGSVIGIAYVPGVCNSNKYHCLQDFSTNSELLRCLASHEIGHNFSCFHDSGGGVCPPNYIMCPFVSTTSEWSSASQNSVNNYTSQLINSGCLSPCGPPPPPLVADFTWDPNPACQGQPVQFTDQSTGNVTGRSWIFPNGTPAGSTQTNPVVTWNVAGTFAVKLTVTGNGGPVSVTKQVLVKPLPVASFTYTVDGLAVQFTSTSSNATTYLWDFGDGNTSDEQNPYHLYLEAGFYTVKLTASNECGSSTKTVLVNTAPTADFSGSPTTGCASFTVNFTNQSSSNASVFVWSFPGGIPAQSNQQNPIVVYQTPGTYNVSLTVSNNSGSSTTVKTNYITVNTVPTTNFTFSANGLTVTFNNTTTGATSYNWSFGDGGTSTETNPVHTYSSAGVYTVILTATNTCGSTNITKTVIVSVPPTAAFTAAPTSGCGPLTVQFTNQSTGNPTSFNWQFPGGTPSSSTEQNPSVVYNTPGTYSVTLTVSNNAGTNTATQSNYITVNAAPTAGFTNSVNGPTATFTNSSANATSYAWNFGDGGTSTLSNPTHTYVADGTYTVTLTATGPCGTATATHTVTILTPPTAGFTAAPTSGCGPLTVQFTNTSSANATSWNWQFPGGTPSGSTQQNPSVVYSTPGTYSVTLTVSNSAGSNTATQSNYITVNAAPTAGFTSSVNGSTATFTNTSTNATSYAWNFGDGGTSTLSNPTHTYAADGVYTVTLTATGPCGTVTTTQTVTIATPPTAGFTAAPTSGCGPLTVQFTNTSSANATSWNWQFPGGTPSSSTQQNPSVVYSTPGTYSVTLTVSNGAGTNTATQTNYITVNPAPAAGFTSNVTGSTASFTNTSTNATSYSWNFGDGGTSTLTNPSHTYANDGTYTVTLTATGPCGTVTFTQNVVIITQPTAGFTANTTTGCAALTVQFQDLSSGNTTSWQWTFPGGTPSSSTEQNPTVVYNTPGVYDVTLVATSAGGSSTFTQTGFITVLAPPTTNFGASVSGATATFTNNSQNATSYMWNFGDGSTGTTANPAHTYLADGTYTVTLTATNNCGSTTFTQQVVIVLPPDAAFTTSGSQGCAPFTVQFANQSSANATNFAWTFQGGQPASSNDVNPSATWSQPGTYTVTLIASNAAGSDTTSATITVNGLPTAGFTAQTAGLSVVLTNISLNADSYHWDFGDGNSSTETNPTHNYGTTGTFTVTLEATNECGTVLISSTVQILGTAPLAAFTVSENSGCTPFSVNFTDQSAGNPTSWQWEFPGGNPGTSDLQNPTVTYSSTGIYSVTLIVTNLYGSDTLTQTNLVTAQSVPSTGFSYAVDQGTVTFTNQSLNATTYLWNFGDGSTSVETNPVHTYAESGAYTVELTAINVCGAGTLQQVVVITVGTKDPDWLKRFNLYPNPNTGAFTVEMSGLPQHEVEFTLFNEAGQLVKRETADFGAGTLVRKLDYGQLPEAVYQLNISAGETAKIVKIVVQR